MNPTPEEPMADDPRLLRAVQEYLADLEAGRRPDRHAWVARFPDLAEALAPYLDALDAVHAASPLLHQPAGDRPAPAAEETLPAEALGDFRIVRQIGRGGMGVVYEAVQRSLGRRVALKVLPFAAALDAKRLQRFQNEAQAAAHLHHPHIVPVYAVGVERGVHFYAMQLIEGQDLAALIGDLRREASGGASADPARAGDERTGPYPSGQIADCRLQNEQGQCAIGNRQSEIPKADTRPSLGAQLSTQRSDRAADFFRTIARLAAQAAEALDHAHGLGIVHRDVKPGNLLVDGHGNVWVTDFGLAQFHTGAALTQTGDLVGTLRYMSPEQAGGQHVLIDHRTDIYSLGATLYELLTLRPIFDGADRETLLRQILHEEPRPPRSLDRSIPPELETIVLKAVSKVPAERYATARDFADDLHRFLRHEPIQARRASLAQRARKWLRRHPSVPIAASVLLVLLAAGTLVSAGFIRAAYQRERQRAEVAEERFQLARAAVDGMIQLAQEELADKPQLAGLRKRLLEAALVYYKEFIEQRRDDAGAQAELATTQARVKQIVDDLAVLQGDGQLFLLKDPAVLDDLRPSPEQRRRIDELSRRLDTRREEAFRQFHRLTPKERQQRYLELARTNEADVAAVLDQQQLRRLGQIALQLQGPAAFRETAVAAALKLTAQQKERIQAIEAGTVFGPPERPRGGPGPGRRGGPGPEDHRRAHDEQLRAAAEQSQKVLTEEQRKRWREMTGEPFQGPMLMVFPGPFRPFGPPGPPGPPGPRDRKPDGNFP